MEKKFDAKVISRVTQWRGATLMRLCDDLGIGETTKGSARAVDLRDLMTLVLVRRLMEGHGLTRDHAIGLALEVKYDRWLQIVADERKDWLFARRDESGRSIWVTTIVDQNGAIELIRDADESWIVVSLYAIARRVMVEEEIIVDEAKRKADAQVPA
jgi:hypothetical protein